jgi:S-adenosylmethionine:tRNA ribosyltransferase-isomerase
MHPRHLSIAEYTYELPNDRIAQHAMAERDASKLLVYRDGGISDRVFRELPEMLPAGSLLVLNDTRVVNARLLFRLSTGARIEVFCLEPANGKPAEQAFAERGTAIWNATVGNSKRWKAGETLTLQQGEVILVAKRLEPQVVQFEWSPHDLTFSEVLQSLGHVPLPPYMKRPDAEEDKERYNTVFAEHQGSVAAPTASLHFSPAVLEGLKAADIRTTALTLHVGAGTFLPVKSAHMAEHSMHSEQVRIPLEALENLRSQLDQGPIIPVGTTALRTVESIYWHGVMILQGRAGAELSIDQWEPYAHSAASLPSTKEALDAVLVALRAADESRLVGSTRLLIAPGYTFRFADALITNFHQPGSTLLLLVAALLGPEWRTVYDHALSKDYRFLSYGDASLLWRNRE